METWMWREPARAGPPAREVFWLQDLLPQQFPDCEIFSIAWPLELSQVINQLAMDIRKFVGNAAPERSMPIAFIVHSVGPFEEACALLDHLIIQCQR